MKDSSLRILVTGGGGVVGRSVIRELLNFQSDYEFGGKQDVNLDIISLDNYSNSNKIDDSRNVLGVRYLDCDIVKPHRKPDYKDKDGNMGLKRRTGRVFDNLLDCDLGQPENYHKNGYKIGNPDIIIHCAALTKTYDVAKNVDNFKEYQHADDYPMDSLDANVIGIKNMLEFAIHGQHKEDIDRRNNERITEFIGREWKNSKYAQIFYISCMPKDDIYVDEYQFTKSLGEELCKFYHRQFNLNVGIFCFKQDALFTEFSKYVVSMIGKDLKGKKYVLG
tara:strand:+ start:946 stop:1779 length:834 start_codon:yes stop_codon:yes gene_type:complete